MRNSNKHNSPPVAQQRPNAPGPRRNNNHQHTTAAAPLRPPVFAPPERHKETHGKHTHTLGPGQDEDRQVESLQKTQTNQKERKKRAAEEARDEQEATKRRERERERGVQEVVRSCGRPHTQETTAGGDRPLQHSSRQAAACQPTRGSSSNNQKNKQQRPRLRALWQQQATNVPPAPPHRCCWCFCYGVCCAADAKGAKKERTTQRQQGQREGDL